MTIDDKTIIQAIREKSEAGFRLLMQKYKQPIYWHIRRLVVAHDDAQDATQEAFIRIFNPSFRQFCTIYSINLVKYLIIRDDFIQKFFRS